MHESFLRYRGFRWLKLAGLGFAATLATLAVPPAWWRAVVVYGLGTLAAGLLLWLLAFAYRRRQYPTRGAPLRGWLSAHVYLGVLPLVLVPVHASFRFGANVHTLAFVLTAAVILTGLGWAACYGTIPAEMTRNRREGKLVELLDEVARVETQCLGLRGNLPEHVADLVDEALGQRRFGWGGRPATDVITRLRAASGADRETVDRLLPLLAWRDRALGQARRETALFRWLTLWRWLHLPLAFAAVAAVSVHVLAVLHYK